MRRLILALLAVCLVAVVLAPSPSEAVTSRSVSLTTSRTQVYVGAYFKLSGRVTHSPKGTPVRIERRTTGAWTLVKTAKTTNSTGAYAWTAAKLPGAGTFSFRARVLKTSTRAAATSAIRSVKASYAPGTLQNPYAVGQAFSLGNWRFQVAATDTDAWPEIAAENQFNEAPTPGWSYVTAPVTFTRLGPDYGNPFWETDWTFVGSDLHAYSDGGDCGVVPNDYMDTGDIYQGGSATGTVCAVVPTSAISGGRWRVTTSTTYDQYRHARIS